MGVADHRRCRKRSDHLQDLERPVTANLERGYEDLRRKALQKDLFSGKLKPDDVKKMGYTADQAKEIISGRRMLLGESWGDFSGAVGRLACDPADGDHDVYSLQQPPRRGLDFKEVRS